MSNPFRYQTNFTAGEIADDVLGRTDLTAYENGAYKLTNVFIDSIGGVSRRSGLRYVDRVSEGVRLISFSFNTEQTYVCVLCPKKMLIYKDENLLQEVSLPYNKADVPFVVWTQSADTLLLVHPSYRPIQILRDENENFSVSNWKFDEDEDGRILQPMGRFCSSDVSLKASAKTGNITVTASNNLFATGHVGCRFKTKSGEFEVTEVENALTAKAKVIKELETSEKQIYDWSEQAFSSVRGYPKTVTFYQGRLVIGGSRDLPNKLWFSKSFNIMNFDTGTGLADESIAFSILSDQVNAICALVPGRHLQVFTSGSEWMVSGDPLTPESIQLKRQTRNGSPLYRYVPPVDVSGATLFASSHGEEIRQFLFDDLEQAYQAKNLSLLCGHLIRQPIDMTYDNIRRIVYIVMNDGTMATLTNYRSEEVLAWSQQTTEGEFLSVAVDGEKVYCLVKRDDEIFLEVFDDETSTDCCFLGEDDEEHISWTGLSILNGKTVKVVGDDCVQKDAVVTGDTLTLERAAAKVEIGLPFFHEIVPLPPILTSYQNAPLKAVRLIEARFRVLKADSLVVDVGSGLRECLLPKLGDYTFDTNPKNVSNDVCVHALGWVRSMMTPLWRIYSDFPKPMKLISVLTVVKVSE